MAVNPLPTLLPMSPTTVSSTITMLPIWKNALKSVFMPMEMNRNGIRNP